MEWQGRKMEQVRRTRNSPSAQIRQDGGTTARQELNGAIDVVKSHGGQWLASPEIIIAEDHGR
jgi:hypothetical protein